MKRCMLQEYKIEFFYDSIELVSSTLKHVSWPNIYWDT